MRSGWIGVAMTIVLLGSCSATTGMTDTTRPPVESSDCPSGGEPMAEAKLYIEHNSTDADTGVHGLFGGDGWKLFCLLAPSGDVLLEVNPEGPLGELGLADLFFESREPPNDEYPIAQLLERFPAGSYAAAGIDTNGDSWVGSARFTHVIPAAPIITSPQLSDDEERIESVVAAGPLSVEWQPVTTGLSGEDVEITGFEVIITSTDHEDPDGWSAPVFDIHVPPTSTSVTVPDGFLTGGASYELEVLALESSGNQTITLGFFRVR
ncbi:MAG: fibronectin type III domain-containing protein [Acidimicrobiia bacterium]|nr:fibronectin type III domain-containing protein [Acidimicrobiia bacterium]